ncbi:MAG: alanine racemase [Candidatus Thorarchaeota archaeon]
MTRIQDLHSPTALVDIERLDQNIADMATKAEENGVDLRPHIKTHKCIEIGKKQLEAGASGITVSTLGEAYAFSKAGFKDITYAVPLAPDKFNAIYDISKMTNLKVLIDNPYTVEILDKFSEKVSTQFVVMLKVDCGNHRCGVDPKKPEALKLARKINEASNLEFKGILAHAGHSYSTKSVGEIKEIALQEQGVMVQFADALRTEDKDLAPEIVSIGSTPTTRIVESFMEGITEIRPGNYVFFDYTQVALGSCELSNCAFTVQASVIGIYPDWVVIDAGATALSKDMGPTHIDKKSGYGQIISDYQENKIAKDFIIHSLSQEHGKIMTSDGNHLQIGDRVRIIPNHSCLTANLYDHYFAVKGESVIDEWKICRQRLEIKY